MSVQHLLLLLVTVTVASSPVAGGEQQSSSLSFECKPNEDTHAADVLFEAWLQRSTLLHNMRMKPWRPNTTEMLESLRMVSDKDKCVYWFRWHPRHGFSYELPTHHCNTDLQPILRDRLALHRAWFTAVIERSAAEFNHSFYFYIDVAYHRRSDKFFNELGAPILLQGKNPHEHYSLPTPDANMIAAHMLRFNITVPERLRDFQRGMAGVYSPSDKLRKIPWSSRKPQAVYRGCCNPTVDSRSANTDDYVMPRGDLCLSIKGNNLFDVAINTCYITQYCKMDQQHILAKLCNKCQACKSYDFAKERLSRRALASYKYQLDVDGFGSAMEGKFWKLKSASTMISVMWTENQKMIPLHFLWWQPLLQVNVHFLATPPEHLPSVVQWCLDNDKRCQQVGLQGARIVKCLVTPEATWRYTHRLLKYLHDMQVGMAGFSDG